MALETKIYSLLTGTTVVTTLLGTRLYPLVAPQAPTYPYAVYFRVSGGQQNGLNGYLDLENPRIQIDIYSTSYSEVKTVAENIQTTMNTSTDFSNVMLSDNDIYEDEVQKHRVSMDFSCFNRE